MSDPKDKRENDEKEIKEPETPENDDRNEVKEPDEEQKIEADHTNARVEESGWQSDKIGEQSSYDSQTNVQKQMTDGKKGRADISENDLHGIRNADKDGQDMEKGAENVGDYVANSGV